eukprot:727790-Amphidinium_carterae.1
MTVGQTDGNPALTSRVDVKSWFTPCHVCVCLVVANRNHSMNHELGLSIPSLAGSSLAKRSAKRSASSTSVNTSEAT